MLDIEYSPPFNDWFECIFYSDWRYGYPGMGGMRYCADCYQVDTENNFAICMKWKVKK
jgi:hypothetical protein